MDHCIHCVILPGDAQETGLFYFLNNCFRAFLYKLFTMAEILDNTRPVERSVFRRGFSKMDHIQVLRVSKA